VDVVRHEAVGVETKPELNLIPRKPVKVKLPIRVVSKDVVLLVTACDDVIHGAGELQPGWP
jgi:hypothetical protein